jgi:DNA-binding beta-propeller fold protein YncE
MSYHVGRAKLSHQQKELSVMVLMGMRTIEMIARFISGIGLLVAFTACSPLVLFGIVSEGPLATPVTSASVAWLSPSELPSIRPSIAATAQPSARPMSAPSALPSMESDYMSLVLSPAAYRFNTRDEIAQFTVMGLTRTGNYLPVPANEVKWSIDPPGLFEMLAPGKIRPLVSKGRVFVTVTHSQLLSSATLLIDTVSNSSGGGGGASVPSASDCLSPPQCRLSVIAGTGEAGDNDRVFFWREFADPLQALFNEPRGVHVDKDGIVYIADTLNHRVKKIDQENGISAYFGRGTAGLGPAIEYSDLIKLNLPYSVVVRNNVSLVSDQANSRIIGAPNKHLATTAPVAGKGGLGFSGDGQISTEAQLAYPRGLVIDKDQHLYVADSLNHRIRKIEANTFTITTIAGRGNPGSKGDGGLATQAELYFPNGLAISPSGELYIADTQNHKIRVLNLESGVIRTFAGTGQAGYEGDGGEPQMARLNAPQGVAIDSKGNVYISDTFNHRIRQVRSNSNTISTLIGPPSLLAPFGLAVDPQDNIYIADTLHHQIKKVTF